jgi:hypothetical protein
MLWVLGLLWVLVVMVPTSFQHRSFLFLLLTGASVILGIGEAARTFGKDGSAFQQKPIGPPPIKDSPQGVSAPAPPRPRQRRLAHRPRLLSDLFTFQWL